MNMNNNKLIITSIKPETSPLVENSNGEYAWLVYDDVHLIRLHRCGKGFSNTCDEKHEMPIVARGYIVFSIIAKSYILCERAILYVYYWNTTKKLPLLKLLLSERKNYKEIQTNLYEWLSEDDIKWIRTSWKMFVRCWWIAVFKNIFKIK